MNRKRVGLFALFAAALLVLAAEPAAAQTSDSTTEDLIWGLNMNLMYVAVPITVLVEGILIYTVWRFRNNEEPLPTMENRRLEITWTIATAIILLFVGVASYQVMAEPYVTASSVQELDTDEDPMEIEVEAQRYGWTYRYNGTGDNASDRVTARTTLVIPEDRPIQLDVTSTDWIHAFHVPGLGLKTDAMPGQYNTILTEATETGEYQLYCAEYCGSGHSQMLGTVDVRTQEEFQSWLDEQQSS